MNNPFQIINAMKNPQEMLMAILNNSQAMKDPRAKKVAELYQNHDTTGLKQMAENMCKSYGTTTEEMINKINSIMK